MASRMNCTNMGLAFESAPPRLMRTTRLSLALNVQSPHSARVSSSGLLCESMSAVVSVHADVV